MGCNSLSKYLAPTAMALPKKKLKTNKTKCLRCKCSQSWILIFRLFFWTHLCNTNPYSLWNLKPTFITLHVHEKPPKIRASFYSSSSPLLLLMRVGFKQGSDCAWKGVSWKVDLLKFLLYFSYIFFFFLFSNRHLFVHLPLLSCCLKQGSDCAREGADWKVEAERTAERTLEEH